MSLSLRVDCHSISLPIDRILRFFLLPFVALDSARFFLSASPRRPMHPSPCTNQRPSPFITHKHGLLCLLIHVLRQQNLHRPFRPIRPFCDPILSLASIFIGFHIHVMRMTTYPSNYITPHVSECECECERQDKDNRVVMVSSCIPFALHPISLRESSLATIKSLKLRMLAAHGYHFVHRTVM
jgi:hypothetical protein